MAGLNVCLECGGPVQIVESRVARAGAARRRRYQCQQCGHRWTTWSTRAGQPLPGPPPLAPVYHAPHRPALRLLTPEQTRLILATPGRSNRSWAQQLGVSREAVRRIRAGLSYRDIARDLPCRTARVPEAAADGPSCERCRSWRDGQCREGFPDPLEEGPGFAADCDFYDPLPVSQSMSRA